MTQENKSKFEFLVDEEYVNNIVQGVFETEFVEDDWDELFERLCDPIYCAVYDTVQEMIEYKKLVERNKDADKATPHYILKYKHPNAYVYDWKQIKRCFLTQADAQAYIDDNRPFGEDEEWKIEKVQ